MVAELRQKLSASMVRDTAMLDERHQLIGTLGTLLEKRSTTPPANSARRSTRWWPSAGLLEQVGSRFADQVRSETGKLETAAAQVAAGASGGRAGRCLRHGGAALRHDPASAWAIGCRRSKAR